jgi:trk/ktr system potassium uptake protein
VDATGQNPSEVKIFVIGAGQVGSTIVESLHDEHDLTVVDSDRARLAAIASRFDVRVVEGDGASSRALTDAQVAEADLLIACTARDETNIVAAMLARSLAPEAKTIVRTTNVEYLEVWHQHQLDIDFIVCSELETALTVSRLIGVPAARQTDVFADGQVQVVEFDVEEGAARARADVIGRPLREAKLPPDARVASIIRAGKMLPPFGRESIEVGDRVIIVGSPEAARAWSEIMARDTRRVDDVVIFGGGGMGVAVARVLLDQGIDVKLIEANAERAREVAELLPRARVLHASGLDGEFIDRERIGLTKLGIFALPDEPRNLYAAVLAKQRGLAFTIAIVHDAEAIDVFEAAGIDIAMNPRSLIAAEIVRFAHDPRTQQVAMLEGDRFEILDITCRSESALVGKQLRELPVTGSFVGAIVRGGVAIIPHGDDVLRPGDRAIVFTESKRAAETERAL